MADLGKYPLDDDELDKVSGGVTANQGSGCNDIQIIDGTKAKTCDNCYVSGFCPNAH